MTMRLPLAICLVLACAAPGYAAQPTPTPRPLPINGVTVDVQNREINGRAHIERPPFAMHRSLHAGPRPQRPHKPKPTPTPKP
ncbi:MAG: hypothetical protein JWM80_1165 [Cyanobacteria bacterium RYN_339]|nr:hypothetical protein [Cyanobacteria bacterium RYN_339]